MNKPTLTKAKLAHALAEKALIKKQDALTFIELFFSTISDTLAKGENVKLSGFGHFQLQDKSSRPGLNPKTGERVSIAPRRVVKFAASAHLKEQVASVDILS